MMKEHMTGGGETMYMIEDMMEGLIELFVFTGTKNKCKVSQADLEVRITNGKHYNCTKGYVV